MVRGRRKKKPVTPVRWYLSMSDRISLCPEPALLPRSVLPMPEERRTRVRSEREQKIAFVTLLPPPRLWNVSTALSLTPCGPVSLFLPVLCRCLCRLGKCRGLGACKLDGSSRQFVDGWVTCTVVFLVSPNFPKSLLTATSIGKQRLHSDGQAALTLAKRSLALCRLQE